MAVNPIKRKAFIRTLIAWGRDNHRQFPWRQETDPFRILVAEVLLQRSRAKTVAQIYRQLFERWPDPCSLAEAASTEVEEVIRPIGLVRRASTLRVLAQEVNRRGGVPASVEELMQLPGVGRYAASATAAAAFGRRTPVVDGVTARVYIRFFGVEPHPAPPSSDAVLWELVTEIAPRKRVCEFNWAVLDLAATICLPKVPRCDACPLRRWCIHRSGHRRVVELFAGVGGFRLGLEKSGWDVVWSNQWEPTTRQQHASECYVASFGSEGHICEDIAKVLDAVEAGEIELPDHELLVGGFPCQDYSVARTLSQASGIQGKKGVLWWEIYRALLLKRPPFILLENVDRLLKSPAHQRGRDFAVMLACLSDLGYFVEWRVVNAADYGFPQKRRRVFIVGQLIDTDKVTIEPLAWLLNDGILAKALPVTTDEPQPPLGMSDMIIPDLRIEGDIASISDNFWKGLKVTPFSNAGIIYARDVWTRRVMPLYDGPRRVLEDVLQDHREVDEAYLIPDDQIPTWRYLKGAKNEKRVHRPSGAPYYYTEGAIPFPDQIDQPSRTILTGEGGVSPSRFKHIIQTTDGRYRRLTPVELERLNGFPDGWTDCGIPDTRRAFLMGNAIVIGVVERVGKVLAEIAERRLAFKGNSKAPV